MNTILVCGPHIRDVISDDFVNRRHINQSFTDKSQVTS